MSNKERIIFFDDYDHGQLDGKKDSKKDTLKWIVGILEDEQIELPSIVSSPTCSAYTVLRAACPVDITISNGVSLLSSSFSNPVLKGELGELTLLGKNRDIKMTALKNDNYTVQLQGTDTGTMDYSLRFFDADNAVIETRDLYDVPVTKDTLIVTDTNMEEPTVLVDKKRPWKKTRSNGNEKLQGNQ